MSLNVIVECKNFLTDFLGMKEGILVHQVQVALCTNKLISCKVTCPSIRRSPRTSRFVPWLPRRKLLLII